MGRVKDWWMDQQEKAFADFESGKITDQELKSKLIELNAYDEDAFLDYLFSINYEGVYDA